MAQVRQIIDDDVIDDDNIFNDDFNLTESFGLTDKQLAIVELYRGGSKRYAGNKTRCYLMMHPNAKLKTANKRASELFMKPEVKRYLSIKGEQLSKKTEVNAESLIADAERLKSICFGDAHYKEILTIDDVDVEVKKRGLNVGGVKAAIDTQARILGLYTDKKEITGKDGAALLPASIEVVYVEPVKHAG